MRPTLACLVALLVAAGCGDRDEPSPTTPASAGDTSRPTIQVTEGMRFVWIPPGSFRMGSRLSAEQGARRYGGEPKEYARDQPQHDVRLTRGFYMGIHEVTQAQWTAYMGDAKWSEAPEEWRHPDRPAEMVSWIDVQSFIARLNEKEHESGLRFRLPSEAEWEYACRAGSTTAFSFGDDASKLGEHAWFDGNSDGHAHPVGTKRPNAWGLFDMHGNVEEWCSDWHAGYLGGSQTDPMGPGEGSDAFERDLKAVRGGCWQFGVRHARSAARSYFVRREPHAGLGFRLAADKR